MQLLPALTRDPKAITNKAPAGAHSSYSRNIDYVTIEIRDDGPEAFFSTTS